MTTVVSFVSEKGGVGKTTTCYHIAIALHRYHRKRVLVVDADYQRGGISGRFFPDLIERFDEPPVGTTIYSKFQALYSAVDNPNQLTIRSWNDSIDLVPSDNRLSTVTVDKLPGTRNIRENNQMLVRHLEVIKAALDQLETIYDYILIDSHPEVSDVLRSVLYASRYCVSPVKLDRQSAIGVATVMAEINNLNADVELMRAGGVSSSVRPETEFVGSIGMMAREYGGGLKYSESVELNRLSRTGSVFKSYVTEGDGLRVAAAQRCPVYDVAGGNALKQAEQYKELTAEFLQRCP